jgi:DNA repair protein RecN (Recombination protein N)
VLKDLGALLLEVHGQHETVGLLDARTHRTLLDAFGAVGVGPSPRPGAAGAPRARRPPPCATWPTAPPSRPRN